MNETWGNDAFPSQHFWQLTYLKTPPLPTPCATTHVKLSGPHAQPVGIRWRTTEKGVSKYYLAHFPPPPRPVRSFSHSLSSIHTRRLWIGCLFGSPATMAVFTVTRKGTSPFDGQKPGTSGLRKKVFFLSLVSLFFFLFFSFLDVSGFGCGCLWMGLRLYMVFGGDVWIGLLAGGGGELCIFMSVCCVEEPGGNVCRQWWDSLRWVLERLVGCEDFEEAAMARLALQILSMEYHFGSLSISLFFFFPLVCRSDCWYRIRFLDSDELCQDWIWWLMRAAFLVVGSRVGIRHLVEDDALIYSFVSIIIIFSQNVIVVDMELSWRFFFFK